MFIFFAYLFSFIAIILAFKLHDKYDPARYFSIIWGGQIILIYSFFQNNFSFSTYGLAYISIACLIFSAGTLFGRLLGTHVAYRTYIYVFNVKRAMFLLKICFILSLANVVLGIYNIGFDFQQIFSFNLLLKLNSAAATSRYGISTPSNLIFQITLIFLYLGPLYGGYILPLISGRKKYWSYISILPSILVTLTQAVKLGFITSIALWSIGVIVSSYANNNSFFKVRIATILKILPFSILFFAILFISMVFRSGRFDLNIMEIVSEKFILYAFGHLPAFDLWFAKNIGDINPTGGVKTFYGISNYLGFANRVQGVFIEFTLFGKNNFSGMGTNVYTLFRFIIEDFGLLGSLFSIFLTGTISGYTWLMIKKRANILFFQTILIAILFSVSLSIFSSVWAYTSYIAMIVSIYFLLIFSFSKTKTGKA